MVSNFNTITGVHINYYFICHRKLWLFCQGIRMEHTSEMVEMGAILHEHSYMRKQKEIQIGPIKIDFFEKNKGLIHEVKKTRSMESSHIWQIKYYIFYLKMHGIDVKGSVDYPLLRKTEKVELTEADIEKLKEIINEIHRIKALDNPPLVINSKICKKCSYYEFCYV